MLKKTIDYAADIYCGNFASNVNVLEEFGQSSNVPSTHHTACGATSSHDIIDDCRPGHTRAKPG